MASIKYDYKFITKPDDNLKCVICLGVAKDPKQHEDCGKLFCSECIENNGSKPCPNCRAENPKYFKDKRGEREIKDLCVKCNNEERGCKWNGTVGTIDDHVSTCKFTLVPCPNQCKAAEDGDLQLMRKDLDDHLKAKCSNREHECRHCGEKGTYASITEEHDKVCEKKIVSCPNADCTLNMERGKTKQHIRTVCDYTEVACAYENLGCKAKKIRKDMKKHEEDDDKVHFHLVLNTLCLREEQHKTPTEGESMTFKMSGYSSKKNNNETFYSEPFYTSPGGYKMCIKVDANGWDDGKGTHVTVSTKVLEGPYDDQLHWPFLGTVTYELLNQLTSEKHCSQTSIFVASHTMNADECRGKTKFISHSALSHDPVSNTQYLMDDTLYFRVTVKVDNHKPWLVCTEKRDIESKKTIKDNKTLKEGESMIFKLTDYSTRKGTDSRFYTDSFYTSPSGYKMCIRVNANANGDSSCEGTHVSVYARILEGPYDNSLHWPFMGTVTFELLNQLADNNHHSSIFKYRTSHDAQVGSNWGLQFISHSALSRDHVRNTQYLMDDTLYFRVTVKINDHKPWLVCTHHTK